MNIQRSYNKKAQKNSKPIMIFIDDRPTSFVEQVLKREDVDWILLRHKNEILSEAHLENTKHLKSFCVDDKLSEDDQIDSFSMWCRENKIKPDRLLNPSEPKQRFAHKLARAMGIPALKEEQVSWLRNKASMKDKLREIGFQTAEHSKIHSTKQIISFGKKYGWPIVLKPQEGSATMDTYLVNSPKDAEKYDLAPDIKWMVETYVDGEEWECCALIQEGRVLDTYISYMPAKPLDIVNGAINANVTVCPHPIDFPVDTRDMIQKIVDGMDLDHGYMHMEFFIVNKKELVIGETALRLAGCEIPSNHALANGFNIFDTLIDIHLGKKVELKYTNNKCAGDLLLPAKAGKIIKMTSKEELLKMPGVIDYKPRHSVGDNIAHKRASHACSAVVHIEGNTVNQVVRRMESVLKQYKIETIFRHKPKPPRPI